MKNISVSHASAASQHQRAAADLGAGASRVRCTFPENEDDKMDGWPCFDKVS